MQVEKKKLPKRNEPQGAGERGSGSEQALLLGGSQGTAGSLLLTTHVPPLTLGLEASFVTRLAVAGWGSPPARFLQG